MARERYDANDPDREDLSRDEPYRDAGTRGERQRGEPGAGEPRRREPFRSAPERGDEVGESLHLLHGHRYWPRDHAGVGPRGYRRTDERIHEDVCEALTRDPDVNASDIEVRVEAGEVHLDGTVPSRDQKRLAEDVAERCSGVHDVHNRLRVAAQGDQMGAWQVLEPDR